MVEELQNTDEELMKLQQCDMLDGVDRDLSNAHFEFRLHDDLPSALKNVEIMMQTSFLAGGQVRMNMIYSDKCFHVVLREGEGEHDLNDVTFPQLEKHGDGYNLRVYVGTRSPPVRLVISLWAQTYTGTTRIMMVITCSFANSKYLVILM